MKELSLVICIQGADRAGASLLSLGKSQLAPEFYEVWVVAHRDNSAAIRKQIQKLDQQGNIQLLEVDASSRAAQMNAAVKQARSDLIVVLADDVEMTPGFLNAHLHFHHDHPAETDVAVGPTIFPPDLRRRRFRRWLDDSGHLFGVSFTSESTTLPPGFFYHANVSFKRSLFEKVGGAWDALPNDACDDQELGWRMQNAGMCSYYLPQAQGLHHHYVGMWERFKLLVKAGRGGRLLDQRYPERNIWLGSLKRRTLWSRLVFLIRVSLAWVLGMRSRERIYVAWTELGWLLGFGRQARRGQAR